MAFRPVVALCCFILVLVSPALRAQEVISFRHGIPLSGQDVPSLTAFDDAITTFMARNGISAGVLALSHDSDVVYQRGYGWTSQARTDYLPATALFRIASLTKPLTKALIRTLEGEGRLKLTDLAFCIRTTQPCHLELQPHGTPDLRLSAITIEHLLLHTGGWDRDITADPTYQYAEAARALGVPSPTSRLDMARWIAGRPLDFAPGARVAYANAGYLFLGLIIEKITGMTWLEYARQTILEPLGIDETELLMGRSLAADRDPREPAYEDPYLSSSVFPDYGLVPRPDGSFDLDTRTGGGNVVTSSRVLAQFLTRYAVDGQRRSVPRADGHTGEFNGTRTLLRSYDNGVGLVLYFNRSVTPAGTEVDLEGLRLLLDSMVRQTVWTSLNPVPVPAPMTPQLLPPAGGLPQAAVTAAPAVNPVPLGTRAPTCTGNNGTWSFAMRLTESADVAATVVERVNLFDGREINRFAMNTRIPGNTTISLNQSWCASPTSAHTVQVHYAVRDGNGNNFSISSPVVRLLPRR